MQQVYRHRTSLSPAVAVTVSEFYDALCSIWKSPASKRRSRQRTLGIAVSGGVDSMALAHLCMKARSAPKGCIDQFLGFHAFIVDHKARSTSTEEVIRVRGLLRSWGLPATVLTLQWPPGVEPAQLPNFESQARRLRYQALGTACRDRLISSLVLAHHEDDQAETIFLRLVQGHDGTGLLGMQPVANIPECHGIYGVHRSGSQEFKDIVEANRRSRRHGSRHNSKAEPNLLREEPNGPLMFEQGGVKIYRPLLEFSKERLAETCRAAQVRWWEDGTNHDPTMTPRNAVRHLLNSTRLPRSLQKPSLLALRNRMAEKAKQRTARAKKSFEDCDISMLDTRSGSLVVRLRKHILTTTLTPPAYRQRKLVDAKYVAAIMLRQLLDIVTPQEQISLPSLQSAIHILYPELKDPTATSLDKHLGPPRFTVGAVMLTRVLSPQERPIEGAQVDEEFIWVMSRRPPFSAEDPTIQIDPLDRHPVIGQFAYQIPQTPKELPTYSIRDFRLWDSRYWFLIHNPTPFPLLVRLLRIDDLRQLRASLPPQKVKQLDVLLRTAAPARIRWTLPVLVQKKAEQGAERETETETVLALPTLRWDVKAKELGVSYEVRYKEVIWGHRPNLDSIIL